MRDKELYALDYLQRRHKLSLAQASGIVGNLIQESSLNTGARNPGDGRDGSDSIGIGQWNGGRARALRGFAADRGTDVGDFDTQLDFVIHELNGSEGRAGRQLFAAQTADEAARAMISYERPAGWSAKNPTAGHGWDNRVGHARRLSGMSPNDIAATASSYVPQTSAPTGGQSAIRSMLALDDAPAMPAAMPAQDDTYQLRGMLAFGDDLPGVDQGAQSLLGSPSNDRLEPQAPQAESDPFADLIMPTEAPAGTTGDPFADLIEPAAPVSEPAAPAVAVGAPAAPAPAPAEPIPAPPPAPVEPAREQGWLEWLSGVPSGGEELRQMAENPEPQYGFGAEMLNSATFGGLDEITAGAMAPIEWAKQRLVDGKSPTVGEAYDANVSKLRGAQKEYRDQNPVASTTAALAGGFLTGPGAALYQGPSRVVQAAENIGRGAATGAATAFGEAEGGVVDRLDNALVGGGIGAAVGGIVPGIGAIARGGRRITGGAAPDAVQVADDFRDLGINPPAGLASGNRSAQYMERAIQDVGLLGTPVKNAQDDAFRAFEHEAGNVADSLGTVRTPQAMGDELVEAGGRSQAVFRDRADRLYGKVDQHMTGEAAESAATRQLAIDLQDELSQLGSFGQLQRGNQLSAAAERANAIVADLDMGLPYDRLASIRSDVGRMYADARKAGDRTEQDYLNRLRVALTSDMISTARRVGPEAERSMNRANAYYARYTNPASAENLDRTIGKLLPDRTGKPPVAEDVYKWVTNGTKDGATKLAALRRQLYKTGERQTFDDLSATVLQRMGQKLEGDEVHFSAAKLITEWGKMSDEAKATLFRGTPNADYPANLDRLIRLGKRFNAYGKTANHSNTANITMMRGLLSPVGVVGVGSMTVATGLLSAGMAAGSAGAIYGMSRLLTSPVFARWLAGAPRAQLQRGGLGQHVVNLTRLAKDVGDPGMKNLIAQYVETVRGPVDEPERR